MSNATIDDLLQMTDRLTAIVEREVTILKGARPAALNTNDDERTTLLAQYSKQVATTKRDMATLSPDAKKRLTAATEKLRSALKEESRLIARFRYVNEGLIKAIADEVAARHTPTAYARAGAFAKPSAAVTSAMTYNQRI